MKVITLRLSDEDIQLIEKLRSELELNTMSAIIRTSISIATQHFCLVRHLRDALSRETVIDMKKLEEIKQTFNL